MLEKGYAEMAPIGIAFGGTPHERLGLLGLRLPMLTGIGRPGADSFTPSV